MKKLSTFLAAAVMGMTSLPSGAQGCIATPSSPKLTTVQIFNLVNGKLVCGRPGPGYPGGPTSSDRWQEEHLVGTAFGGQLWDYKLGANAVDPRKQVGSWAVPAARNQPDTIAHSYIGSASPFIWTVYGPPPLTAPPLSVYSFCAGVAEHVRARVVVIPATGGCTAADYP